MSILLNFIIIAGYDLNIHKIDYLDLKKLLNNLYL